MLKLLLPFLFCLNAFAAIAPSPNTDVTQGTLCTQSSADFDGYRYPDKVAHCRRNVSHELKQQIYAEYDIPKKCQKFYTIDHFIPLSLGGSNDAANLWPEHKEVKHTRQSLEEDLYYALRRGDITQGEAVTEVIQAKVTAPEIQVPDCH